MCHDMLQPRDPISLEKVGLKKTSQILNPSESIILPQKVLFAVVLNRNADYPINFVVICCKVVTVIMGVLMTAFLTDISTFVFPTESYRFGDHLTFPPVALAG